MNYSFLWNKAILQKEMLRIRHSCIGGMHSTAVIGSTRVDEGMACCTGNGRKQNDWRKVSKSILDEVFKPSDKHISSTAYRLTLVPELCFTPLNLQKGHHCLVRANCDGWEWF